MNQVGNWVKTHPRLTAWIVLAVGMNAMVVYEARSVGLLLGQWTALVIATTLVAGLCVWIIGWEDDEDDEPANASTPSEPTANKPADPIPTSSETKKSP
jgi:hypothetical protein